MIWKLLDGYRYHYQISIEKIIDKINKKYPNLKLKFPVLKSILRN